MLGGALIIAGLAQIIAGAALVATGSALLATAATLYGLAALTFGATIPAAIAATSAGIASISSGNALIATGAWEIISGAAIILGAVIGLAQLHGLVATAPPSTNGNGGGGSAPTFAQWKEDHVAQEAWAAVDLLYNGGTVNGRNMYSETAHNLILNAVAWGTEIRFGHFDNDDTNGQAQGYNFILLNENIKSMNPVDMSLTIAHELVHIKDYHDGKVGVFVDSFLGWANKDSQEKWFDSEMRAYLTEAYIYNDFLSSVGGHYFQSIGASKSHDYSALYVYNNFLGKKPYSDAMWLVDKDRWKQFDNFKPDIKAP